MIKFFRKIRKRLLTESKFSKYLLYAIGEILLVVIGILIALSINNWNEQRKDILQEQKILLQLKSDFNKNLEQLDVKISMRSDILQASIKLLGYIDNPEFVEFDSIIQQLSFLITDPTFDPIRDNLIESGNLHLIRHDSLRLKLTNWSTDVYQLQEVELEYQKVRTAIIIPFYEKTGLHRNIINTFWKDIPIFALNKTAALERQIGNTKKELNVSAILNNIELEGIVADSFSWSNIGNIQSLALRNQILEILNLIDSEIKE
ncbi:hypothetical protein SAMN03097699_0671 [Flavobacteriaceae bacterium MAR_2010_188]|nr:hypothetical protein SAMN03097699_0671 [Flavobacteriaceae bacterium MAR_2010_188]